MAADPKLLAQSLGHEFRDPSLLLDALTHRSHPGGAAVAANNQRLEFLGDSILGFVVSAALFARFPDYPEGKLTKIKAFLVSAKNLVRVGRRLAVGDYLLLGKGEETGGGRSKPGLIVDAVEALIAAVYFDAGMPAAQALIERLILDESSLAEADENLVIDNYKSALQEWLQSRKMDPPEYNVIAEEGPPHRRLFTVEVGVGTGIRADAVGGSKKAAEQDAAARALALLKDAYPQETEVE